MKDKERKNRPLVKSLLKSPKQIAKDKWIEVKMAAETGFNEMSNSVACSVDQLKEELVNQIESEIDFIKDQMGITMQQAAYYYNKATRLYNKFKYAKDVDKKKILDKIWEELNDQGEEAYNSFIAFMTVEVISPLVDQFKDLWNCGVEAWEECALMWKSLISFIEDIKGRGAKFNPTIENIISLLNSLLPVILSLSTLMANYLTNKELCKDSGAKVASKLETDNLRYKEVPESNIKELEKENEKVQPEILELYKKSPEPSTFKIEIPDCKLYPLNHKDVYDLSLGCWIEPSQLLRVIREDQGKIKKSASFISNNNDSDSNYDQYDKGQEESLCYIIPPSKRDSNDIIEDSNNDMGTGDCLHAIIEFDDDCCAVPAEPYSWKCLPGELVYEDKVLADCLQYEHMVPVKSIFTKGVIRKDPCTGDFARIRKDVCDRHIIIDCIEDGTKGILDASLYEQLLEDFKREACMSRLFYEYMPFSILPNIIARKKYYTVPSKLLGFTINPKWIDNNNHPEAYNEVYLDYIAHYEQTIENFKKEIQEIDNEKRIKATKGDHKALESLMNEVLAARNKLIFGIHNWAGAKDGIIDLYDSYKDNLHLTKCFDDYRDARGLGETYYTDLIAMLQFTEQEKCIKDYYELLEEIIYKREMVEGYDWHMLKRKICGELDSISSLDWKDLEEAYSGPNDFNTILTKVSAHVYENLSNVEKRVWAVVNLYMLYKRKMVSYKNHYSEYGSLGFEKGLFYGYDHLKEEADWNLKNSGYSNSRMLDLVKEERTKLEEFFKAKRTAHSYITIDKLLKRLKDLQEDQAEWPPYVEIFVDGIKYRLYKFANIDAWLKKNARNKGTDNSLADGTGIDPNSYNYKEISDDDLKKQIDGLIGPLGNANDKALASDDEPLVTDDVEDKFCPMMEVPITDIKYWKKYCGLATLLTIPYLATGLVILGAPIPFPAIYIPIKVINGDVLMVIGIGNRGITFWPMIIYVNANHDYSSALVPILLALKMVRDQFEKQLTKLEASIPNVADLMIDQLESNNANLLNQNKQIDIQIANLKAMHKPEWSQVKRQIQTYLGIDPRNKVTRLE